jgi:glycosyltransferase involved in cell wall biosynthesis
MPGVYALADIVVNYPSSDAFPSTLLEAAACARPVITSAITAYRNTFVEQFCQMVEPENPARLADAIVQIAQTDRARAVARAQQAREAVLAEHEESIQKQRLMALYHQIAQYEWS